VSRFDWTGGDPAEPDPDGSVLVTVPVGRQDWADLCNTTVESISRQIAELASERLVESLGGKLYRAAITDALARDERVFLMGEDVGAYGGCYAVSMGLLAEFGPERIRDTPLSEGSFTGAGIGSALSGMRPIV
jgi:hypothetical protein